MPNTLGLIHHSDPGGQYVVQEYRALLGRAGMHQSMSGATNVHASAFTESSFAAIKTALDMVGCPA